MARTFSCPVGMTSVSPGKSFDSARRRSANAAAFRSFGGIRVLAGFHCRTMKSSSADGGAVSWVAGLAGGSGVTGSAEWERAASAGVVGGWAMETS